MKINFKLIFIRTIVLISIFIIAISLFSNVFGTEDHFDVKQFSDSTETDIQKLAENSGKTSVAVLRVVSVAVSIVILLVIAMKYMISSAGDRADIKKHAVAYVIGTFILFSAAQIIALLIEIADTTFSAE